jgi:SAM-dependent methyltransferase
VAFISLHDIDALGPAVREIARILEPGGRLGFAIVDPINSAGGFERRAADAPFVIKGDYLRPFRYSDTLQRDGLIMTLHGQHRPVEAYFGALEGAGLLVEALRETEIPEKALTDEASRRWQRVPLFLHVRARRL